MTAPSCSDFGDFAWRQSAAFRQLLEDERRDADRAVVRLAFFNRSKLCADCPEREVCCRDLPTEER